MAEMEERLQEAEKRASLAEQEVCYYLSLEFKK